VPSERDSHTYWGTECMCHLDPGKQVQNCSRTYADNSGNVSCRLHQVTDNHQVVQPFLSITDRSRRD
jgi:hypothetical protein